MTREIFNDARSMVNKANGGISTPQKTVAMNCIRDLESDSENIAAILPMILEMYLQPAAAVLIENHHDSCLKVQKETAKQLKEETEAIRTKRTIKDALLSSIDRYPIAAAIVVAAWILRDVVPALVR